MSKRFLFIIGFLAFFFLFSSPTSAQSTFPPVDEAAVADIANRWFGLPVGEPRLDMLPTVISYSLAAGIDPNFTIAIWLHETDASNYAGICQIFGQSDPTALYCQRIQDFGYNLPQYETQIDVNGNIIEDHFLDQLTHFLGLAQAYAGRCGCADMYSFMALYRTGDSCTPSCGDIAYLEDIKRIYGWITGSPADFPDYPNPTLFKTCNLQIDSKTCENPELTFNFSAPPLRPFANQPIAANPPLTPYCAMRPTPVEMNRFDIRDQYIDLVTKGALTQDFTNFVTPLLSITDPKKADYQLPFNNKAQRYLADFLEGRAYYEPQAEPANPTFSEQSDLFNRMGVFRKLAPQQYQNELKRAVIYRAVNHFSLIPNPYGFSPASETINNYTVGFWQNQPVTLKDYFNNHAWAPLPEEYENNPDETFTQAYYAWKNQDGGKWYSLWPYVPMFTREDSTGRIDIIDSNPPLDPWSPPGSTPVEVNHTAKKSVDVIHPHLARTYEVSTSLNHLLLPAEYQKYTVAPQMANEWIPKLWEGPIWWLDPSYKKPRIQDKAVAPLYEIGLDLGPLCDADLRATKPIRSSGDLAFDSIISTNVNRQDLNVVNPEYDPEAAVWEIDQCTIGGITIDVPHQHCETVKSNCSVDDSKCYYFKQIRSNPNYLITYTPFLNEITANLMSTESGIFNLFRPAGASPQPYEKYSWPGLGNEGEESPKYDFTADSGDPAYAEAGARKPGDTQSYYYRYLGSVQCAKEKVLQVLQPFITGQSYKPYAYDCFPEMSPPPAPPGTPGTLPTGDRWLQWPTKNHAPARISQCFGAPGDHPHAGLDFVAEPDDGAPIYPGAVGTVVRVDHDTVNVNGGFGYFVIIKHDNGYSTIYSHLYPDIRVHEGQTVGLDTQLGRQDTTGNSTSNHVHFGLAKGSALSDFYWSGSIEDPCAAMQNCSCSQ